MQLVIAEKPDSAEKIAKALDPQATKDRDRGCFKTQVCLVTWAQGHLLELAYPSAYLPAYNRSPWSMSQLPIIPQKWKKVIPQKQKWWELKKQLKNVTNLICKPEVTEIVNACDPDREGEGIFREIMDYANCRKPTKRLWSISLEGSAIRKAWNSMESDSSYDDLANAADTRRKADWLLGMNATRAYTVAYGNKCTLQIGRVKTPTLAMVVKRDNQVRQHPPKKFWQISADMGGWKLLSDAIDNYDKALEYLEYLKNANLIVDKKHQEAKNEKAPRLYNTTTLQIDMSEYEDMTAEETLDVLQNLYINQLSTYPRTDSEYITNEDKEDLDKLFSGNQLIDGILDQRQSVVADSLRNGIDSSVVADDKKTNGHTAIIPTPDLFLHPFKDLDENSLKVLRRIVIRTWEACAPSWEHVITTIDCHLDDLPENMPPLRLRFTQDITTKPCWHSFEEDKEPQTTQRPSVLPEEGQKLTPVAPPTLKPDMYYPIKHFTDGTLIAEMQHPHIEDETKPLEGNTNASIVPINGIGTPATRSSTIEELIKDGLIERDKGDHWLTATCKGRQLTHIVYKELKSVTTTALWEQKLQNMENGLESESDFLSIMQYLCQELPEQASSAAQERPVQQFGPGICPICGETIIKAKDGWECPQYKWKERRGLPNGCGWKLQEDQYGVHLTDHDAIALLNHNKIEIIDKKETKAFFINNAGQLQPMPTIEQ